MLRSGNSERKVMDKSTDDKKKKKIMRAPEVLEPMAL